MKINTVKNNPYVPLTNQAKDHIPTGIPTLDYTLNGLTAGTVTLITGRPSDGKSTFVHGIILNAIDKNKNVYLIDGEHEYNGLLNKMFRKVIGSDKTLYRSVHDFMRTEIEPKPQVQELLTEWFSTKLSATLKHESDLSDFDILFNLARDHAKASDVGLIVFDNLMSLVDSTQSELNARQSNFMKRCSSLAKQANAAVVLVSHPNGTAEKGKVIDYYQISGTADLPNLADNIIQIIKDPVNDEMEIECDGMAVVLKNRYYGECPKIKLAYDSDLMGLYEIRNNSYSAIKYDWRMEGKQEWITEDNPPF